MVNKNYHWVVVLMMCMGVAALAGRLFAADRTEGQDPEPAFVVIVHVSNSQTTLTQADLSKLFLKKLKIWPKTNIPVLPVDQLESAAVREQFSEHILGKKMAALKAYWQKEIFSGRNVPPPEKETDADVLKYVAERAGAIGYVAPSAEIDAAKVAIVHITE